MCSIYGSYIAFRSYRCNAYYCYLAALCGTAHSSSEVAIGYFYVDLTGVHLYLLRVLLCSLLCSLLRCMNIMHNSYFSLLLILRESYFRTSVPALIYTSAYLCDSFTSMYITCTFDHVPYPELVSYMQWDLHMNNVSCIFHFLPRFLVFHIFQRFSVSVAQ